MGRKACQNIRTWIRKEESFNSVCKHQHRLLRLWQESQFLNSQCPCNTYRSVTIAHKMHELNFLDAEFSRTFTQCLFISLCSLFNNIMIMLFLSSHETTWWFLHVKSLILIIMYRRTFTHTHNASGCFPASHAEGVITQTIKKTQKTKTLNKINALLLWNKGLTESFCVCSLFSLLTRPSIQKKMHQSQSETHFDLLYLYIGGTHSSLLTRNVVNKQHFYDHLRFKRGSWQHKASVTRSKRHLSIE